MNTAPIGQFLALQQERIQPLLLIGTSATNWPNLTTALEHMMGVQQADTVDVHTVPSIAELRQIIQRIQLRPLHGSRTLVVFHSFDAWSPELATTLLKTIEEPPSFAALVLYATKTTGILPTIRSRVATFRLSEQAAAAQEQDGMRIVGLPLKDQFSKIQKLSDGDTSAQTVLSEWLVHSKSAAATRHLLELVRRIGDAPVNRRIALESAALVLQEGVSA